jgi:hypothetical protein
MYKLIQKFYFELDNILTINNEIKNQEYLVFLLNDTINDNKSLFNKILLLKQKYTKQLYKKYLSFRLLYNNNKKHKIFVN